ncbi:GAF domain-containing sensor histidine kinase [bacterium]|nr:MAG: GAF domain-containing sensor histidine kinase [bacterium]
MRRFFERATDRVFFRDHYDAQALLDRVSSIFATELELNPLMNKFLRELTKTMRLVNAQLVVMEGKSVYGQTAHGKLVVAPLGPDSLPVFKHPLMVADLMPAAHAKHVMVAQGIQVVTQLRAHGELVGYLALGDKQAGTVYSNEDLAVLEIMRKELSVAVANAKAYDEISQFNVTLQQRIRDATKRLKIANTNLRALDKTKDEFISMASHQLGTPLTAITGYLSMTLDSDKNNLTADQKEFVSYALEAAEKMVYMSGDMLNVSRLNSGRFMIQRQPAELVKMVQQEIHQLEPAAARKGLTLTTELPDTPVTLSIDESKTRQVIMNFIDNALYYTETGGVHVKLEQTKTHVILTVSDTGMGVPMAEQSKLFAKFYRAANAKSVRPDGTGLGLYLAKRVIEDQGGQLIFSSIEGKGSTFGFKLSKQDT